MVQKSDLLSARDLRIVRKCTNLTLQGGTRSVCVSHALRTARTYHEPGPARIVQHVHCLARFCATWKLSPVDANKSDPIDKYTSNLLTAGLVYWALFKPV